MEKGIERLLGLVASKQDTADDRDALPEETLKKIWTEKVRSLVEDRYRKNTWIRLVLAIATQLIIIGWVVVVIIILMNNNNCYKLSDPVLLMLLGTTTTTIIGLALIVLRGFFKEMKQDVELRDY